MIHGAEVPARLDAEGAGGRAPAGEEHPVDDDVDVPPVHEPAGLRHLQGERGGGLAAVGGEGLRLGWAG